ncbi:hypothetical protein ACFQI5_13505 [Mammaliicoccus vitulinus]|uniref:hypothetical protein n=1 Tax=Mammaliicoccus vitulinus TaxID=71237 RepID=UPI00360861F9
MGNVDLTLDARDGPGGVRIDGRGVIERGPLPPRSVSRIVVVGDDAVDVESMETVALVGGYEPSTDTEISSPDDAMPETDALSVLFTPVKFTDTSDAASRSERPHERDVPFVAGDAATETVDSNVTALSLKCGTSNTNRPDSSRTDRVHVEPSSWTPWTRSGTYPSAAFTDDIGSATSRPS